MGEADDPDHDCVVAAEELFEEVEGAVDCEAGRGEEAGVFLEFFEVVEED